MMYNKLCCKDKNYFSIFHIIRHHFNLNSVHPQKKVGQLVIKCKGTTFGWRDAAFQSTLAPFAALFSHL